MDLQGPLTPEVPSRGASGVLTFEDRTQSSPVPQVHSRLWSLSHGTCEVVTGVPLPPQPQKHRGWVLASFASPATPATPPGHRGRGGRRAREPGRRRLKFCLCLFPALCLGTTFFTSPSLSPQEGLTRTVFTVTGGGCGEVPCPGACWAPRSQPLCHQRALWVPAAAGGPPASALYPGALGLAPPFVRTSSLAPRASACILRRQGAHRPSIPGRELPVLVCEKQRWL